MTAELQVIPVGASVSVRQQVMRIVELLHNHDFILETHAAGTNIEDELTDVLAAIRLFNRLQMQTCLSDSPLRVLARDLPITEMLQTQAHTTNKQALQVPGLIALANNQLGTDCRCG